MVGKTGVPGKLVKECWFNLLSYTVKLLTSCGIFCHIETDVEQIYHKRKISSSGLVDEKRVPGKVVALAVKFLTSCMFLILKHVEK